MSAYTTTASVKGQIVIPAPLRRKYHIRDGTRILVVDEGDHLVLRPVTEAMVAQLRGSLKGKGALRGLMDERARDAENDA